MSPVDFTDVQGLIRFGYGRMTSATYALVQVKSPAAARAWLRTAPIANAVKLDAPPKAALHIAFTAPGLEALGVCKSIVESFSHEFRGGMASESRARQLGDAGSNDPRNWAWGGSAQQAPHALIMFFGEPQAYDPFVASLTGAEWEEAFHEITWLPTSDLGGREPFGFADGISQPNVDWDHQRAATHAQVDYANEAALGEFLLGYRNEYGKFTERPLLVASAATAELLPALDEPEKRDLGRNGTYLVMRQLEQDVRGFWQFASKQSGSGQAEAEGLAAKMVGRTLGGDPLVLPSGPAESQSQEKDSRNRFTFDADPAGARCPFGAHIRRANPRNSDFPQRPASLPQKLITMLGFGPNGFRDDLMSSVRFHRILRRGREYGPYLSPSDAAKPAPPDDVRRGLYFICLNANISRQFEFLQNAWMSGTKFSGLTEESDPLLGNRQPLPGCPLTNHFTVQREGQLRRRISGLPQFVTVCGGAYFFLPSLRAMRYIAGGE